MCVKKRSFTHAPLHDALVAVECGGKLVYVVGNLFHLALPQFLLAAAALHILDAPCRVQLGAQALWVRVRVCALYAHFTHLERLQPLREVTLEARRLPVKGHLMCGLAHECAQKHGTQHTHRGTLEFSQSILDAQYQLGGLGIEAGQIRRHQSTTVESSCIALL